MKKGIKRKEIKWEKNFTFAYYSMLSDDRNIYFGPYFLVWSRVQLRNLTEKVILFGFLSFRIIITYVPRVICIPITHEEIFFSETLEWTIVSLLSLILHGTSSKLQVCLGALVLCDIVFPMYVCLCLFAIFFALINLLVLHQPSHTPSDLSNTPPF